MADDELIAYCGLYCGICTERLVVPGRAAELRELVRDEGYDEMHRSVTGLREHYPSFVQVLEYLSALDCTCRSRAGCSPGCPIRDCASERRAFVCMDCDDFPCERWSAVSATHPLLVVDARRYKELGRERWAEEQKSRGRKGFHYGMVKTPHSLRDM